MKTFVFTDIVRSVDLKGQMTGRSDAERDAAYIDTVLTPHREHIEIGLADAGGRVVSTAGDGHFLVFENPILAAAWAVDVQRRHRDRPIATPRDTEVQVRMGLHVGFPQVDPSDPHNFVGKAVDYAARLTDLATGGQVLVSVAALGLLRDAGLDGIAFHHHGDRLLRGIGAVEVNEVLYDGGDPRPLTPSEAPETDVAPIVESAAAAADSRVWTVLPPTMGLTEFSRQKEESDGAGAAVKPPPTRTLGNYEVGELIGAGGMGNVYKARHRQFERTRAIKIIKPHFVEDDGPGSGHQEVVRRFYREIKAIGRLDHPNIVVAIDSSAPDAETHYLVMEYVDGVSSEQLISRRRRLSVPDACEIVRQAAVGLEYIHRQGMVHRDIKPSNLMLTDAEASSLSADAEGAAGRRPLVKILDLGLALLVTDDQPRFTRFDHGAMGTAMYMSPEQWVTTSVDIRSDIYSLGCTLYHLLTGRPPYYDSDLKPQRAHERAPTPSVAAAMGAPPGLDAVLARMMAKTPAERFGRPADVAEAILPFCREADLLTLVDRARHGPSAKTDANAHGETLPTGQGVSDTFSPLPRLPDLLPSSAPPATAAPSPPRRPLAQRLITPVAIAVTVAVVLWLGQVVQRQSARIRAEQERVLRAAATPAARALGEEIDKRFRVLREASGSPELLAAMASIDARAAPPPGGWVEGQKTPADASELASWRALQTWLTNQRGRATREEALPSNSWFVTDRYGRQVARDEPGQTIGNYYHNRDYFHGRGRIERNDQQTPITAPRQSSVYRSSSTKLLKVAFSVPITDARSGKTLGVLAMSLNLGDFKVLENAEELPEGLEVLLIDQRTDVPTKRGMVLHHRELARYEDPEDPFVLPGTLLDQIDTAFSTRLQSSRPKDPILRGYSDLLERPDRGSYTGAFQPVLVSGPEGEPRDSGWVVVVQTDGDG